MTSHPRADQVTGAGQAIPFWRDERVLRVAAQVVSAVLVVGFLYWGISNFLKAADQRGLSLGFSFLKQSAGFPIGEYVVPYDPSQSFLYAFLVGILNTLKVAVIGILLATIFGLFIGLARLSSNWLVNHIALAYIEAHRNIPLLVLLLLWYRGVFTTRLPSVANSVTWPGPIYLNQRGVTMVWPRLNPNGTPFLVSVIVAILAALIVYKILEYIQVTRGRSTYFGLVALVILLAVPALGWFLAGGDPIYWDVPIQKRFNFVGGISLTPEFAALLIGLVTYTAAFIAEVVRAGIQAVSRGQVEAALAVGLSYRQILRLVVLPQALRVIIPPLISQYLNLTKNSSLAFFIGYPELFAVGRIMTNQAGRAVPVIAMVMATYLSMSLFTSLILNVYNRRIQFVEK